MIADPTPKDGLRVPENKGGLTVAVVLGFPKSGMSIGTVTVATGAMSKAGASAGNPGLLHFVIIKPSHYDDEGYPIQWWRSAIPSNTLACLNGLAEDAQARQVLGPNVEIRIDTFDETNRRVRPEQIIRRIRRGGGRALIGFVGVQSNQFNRANGLAQPFLASGLQ